MFTLEKTYKMETPPDSGMPWGEYDKLLKSEWELLLNGQPPSSEPAVQEFLEQHPSLVPGAFNALGSESGHYPWHSALISQPPLPSYNHKIPDFMWLSRNSGTEEPVLIEIEAPSKRWFKENNDQTADFSHALNQIQGWKAWFQNPLNVQGFQQFYGLDVDSWRRRHFRPAYVLIYGRRSDADANPHRTALRAHFGADDVVLMTFDRLTPNPKADQFICVKANRAGELRAISVPPTLKWSANLASDRAPIQNLPDAINRSKGMTDARKDFLIRRLRFWNDWVKSDPNGTIYNGDQE